MRLATAPYPSPLDGLTHRERKASAIPASVIARTIRLASGSVACATCRELIDIGDHYREDRLLEPVFGQLLVSAICTACIAEGL